MAIWVKRVSKGFPKGFKVPAKPGFQGIFQEFQRVPKGFKLLIPERVSKRVSKEF